ncbi:MAG: CPBP family intramembrane metalloprotease [Sorangiineae bacterium PRO1]|nr:CPBP family intramembrane metalloprotease [Sorangiineae bacterium PRO1]
MTEADPSRTSPRAGRWPLGSGAQLTHAVVVSFAIITHFFVGFALIGPALGLTPDRVFDGSSAALLMTAAQGVWGLGLVVGVGLLLIGRLKPADVGWRFHDLGRDVALGALGALLLIVCVLGPAVLAGRLGVGETLATIRGFSPGQRAQILLIGVLAAGTEETVFRGYLQPGLVARLGFPAGLLVGALLFGLYHFPMGLPLGHLASKAVSGVVLGLLRGRDRSLVAPAFAHFLFWQLVGFT